MQLDHITLVLRPRSSWEAMELGAALLRRHAGVVWRAWALAQLPLLLVLGVLAWAIDGWALLLLPLLLWWLKPLYDRIPLYVLSRAAFGTVPGVRESALASIRFGRDRLLADLTWHRISLNRALLLPVSILEDVRGSRLAARRRAIHGHGGSVGAALTLLCMHFELVILLAPVFMAPLFVPDEFISGVFQSIYELLNAPPPDWLLLVFSLVVWLTYTLIEPFYIAAGFGIYLNSRVHLEAWDIELAFRGMSARLRALAKGTLLGLVFALGMPALPAQAASGDASARVTSGHHAAEWDAVFTASPDPRFQQAVDEAYRDPLLRPKRMQSDWEWRSPFDWKSGRKPGESRQGLGSLVDWMGGALAMVAEVAMWGIVALCVLAILWLTRHWWPTLWQRQAPVQAPGPVDETPAPHQEHIPDDVAAAVRALWAQGRPRAALALLYRAAVQVMASRLHTELPPGATEAQCLRMARKLPDADDRAVFADVVRAWQYAAYAQRLPDNHDFAVLVQQAAARFGWRT